MAGAGSVSWMFTKKGYIVVEKSVIGEDDLMNIVLEAGAEDLKTEDDKNYEIYMGLTEFEKVKKALDDKKIKYELAEVTMIPSNYVKVTGNDARGVLSLVEALEEHEDVQNVYVNFDIPDEIIEEVSNG
jgi:transcriptional/translational regulatory protein YebC/TACO1